MLGRLVAAILLVVLGFCDASAQTEHGVALVIGNSNYSTVGRLKNPVNDAKAIAEMLRSFGFDVVEQEDATRRSMILATRTFAEKLTPGGIGLFYYAGHGMQVQGINYLVPIDAALAVEDDLKYEAVDLQDVLNKLDDARVRLSVVILDACRDNPFAKSFRSSVRGLARIDPPRGSIIAYSTGPGRVAKDGDGNNSVYTTELLKAMSVPGLRLQDVFARVTDAVELQTQKAQTPWTTSSFRGDFYFIGPPPVTLSTSSALPSTSAEALEESAWAAVSNSSTPAPFEAFLRQFSTGVFAGIARAKIDELKTLRETGNPRLQELAVSNNPLKIREQLADIVSARQCTFVSAISQDNGEVTLTGIIGFKADQDLRQAVSSQALRSTIQWHMVSVNTAFCPVLEMLHSIAPGFTPDQPQLALSLADNLTILHDGNHIRPRLLTPNFPSYVRVDYIVHDGTVQHLYPRIADTNGVGDVPKALEPAAQLALGDPTPDRPGWEIGEPYGTDMIIATASSKQLFDTPRASNAEPAAKYIRDLQAAIHAVRETGAHVVGDALLVNAMK